MGTLFPGQKKEAGVVEKQLDRLKKELHATQMATAKGGKGKLKTMLLRAMCLAPKQRTRTPIELPAGLRDAELVRH